MTTDRNDDRLVHKHDDEDLNVPPQRADEVTPGTHESHDGTLPGRPGDPNNDLDNDLGNDLDGDRRHEPGDGRLDGRPGPFGQDTPAGVTDRRDIVHGDVVSGDIVDDDGTPTVIADRRDDVLDRDDEELPTDRPGPVHAAGAPTAEVPLLDHDAEQVRRRWQEVQAGFVDDPRDSVERADSLVGEITASLRTALETRTTDLQGRWKNSGEHDTEELRTALRDYRAMLDQLLSLSNGTR